MAEPASSNTPLATPPRSAPPVESPAADPARRGVRTRQALHADVGESGLAVGGAPRWLREALAKRGLRPDGRGPIHHLLTERDLPDEEDEKVSVHTVHDELSRGLCEGLVSRYRGRENVFVAHDLFVYSDGPKGPVRLSPDLFVSFGAPKGARGSYVVWREGKPPDFVLEILSESTWRKDLAEKPGLYEQMGVREYFLFDPHGHVRPRLRAWRFLGSGRRELPLGEVADGMRGTYSEVLGLHLCHTVPWRALHEEHPEAGQLRWHDPAAGLFLETTGDSARRADAERKARQAAEQQAESERKARQAAEQRADKEAGARRALEARLAELEARLRGQ